MEIYGKSFGKQKKLLQLATRKAGVKAQHQTNGFSVRLRLIKKQNNNKKNKHGFKPREPLYVPKSFSEKSHVIGRNESNS